MESKILVENGKFEDDDSLGTVHEQQQRIKDIIKSAAQKHKPLVVHFHGGLVSRITGEKIANRLGPKYEDAGGIPLFFVWQTGLLETIEANYKEVFGRALSSWGWRFIKKLIGRKVSSVELMQVESKEPQETEIALSDLPETISDEIEEIVKAEIDDPELDEIAERLLEEYSRGVPISPSGGPPLEVSRAFSVGSSGAMVVNADTPEAATLNPELFNINQTEGFFSDAVKTLFKNNILGALAVAAVAVVNRYRKRNHHGLQATVMEELSRQIHGDKIGAVFWRLMKSDAKESFSDVNGDQYAGSWLLKCLNKAADKPNVMLVGHSAGSVYICHLLKQVEASGPFNIALMAPAATYKLFDEALATAKTKIANFRMFTMRDALEKGDDLINPMPYLYPSSLLYLISGILEPKVDMPILGMERYYSTTYAAKDRDEELLQRVRAFLNDGQNRIVWSRSDEGPGLSSNAADHGDFDETGYELDGMTVDSICHIINHGY